jgi:hypothetical protein
MGNDNTYDRAARYLQRAAELRDLALAAKDDRARALLFETADDYVTLAQAVRTFRAEVRLAD